MNVLLLYAHPDPASFTAALKNTCLATLRAAGHHVEVRDLYELGFDPVFESEEFAQARTGQVGTAVRVEQELIAAADVLLVIKPLWWTGLPAILKGYIDRVFTNGFAYAYSPTGLEPLLRGKKAILLTPHGVPAAVYGPTGMFAALRLTQDEGIFTFCGLEVRQHLFFDLAAARTEAARAAYLAEAAACCQHELDAAASAHVVASIVG
ncbi:NAD(P)H-dependent oxidoreductase [Hymenobacter terrenus]|uniref:NAD(P)H-dependent oxidoreductase n=1 Tax=Hymenobacter terrenus TaxID=1629124 RepID=UPI000698E745|nr:NAD(P)H-dependent oxidoreductase [Hymenobacter terrenus]